jgi:hypothetical protein
MLKTKKYNVHHHTYFDRAIQKDVILCSFQNYFTYNFKDNFTLLFKLKLTNYYAKNMLPLVKATVASVDI